MLAIRTIYYFFRSFYRAGFIPTDINIIRFAWHQSYENAYWYGVEYWHRY